MLFYFKLHNSLFLNCSVATINQKNTSGMKNILLATDFSQNAYMAAIHAAGLARYTGARLIIFHALEPVPVSKEKEESRPDSEEEVQHKLDALAAELYRLFGISVTRLLKPGSTVNEILSLAEKTGADLLMAGARGAGRQDERSLGSMTAKLLASCNYPLVCVGADAGLSLYDEVHLLLREKPEGCNAGGLQLLTQIAGKLTLDKPVME